MAAVWELLETAFLAGASPRKTLKEPLLPDSQLFLHCVVSCDLCSTEKTWVSPALLSTDLVIKASVFSTGLSVLRGHLAWLEPLSCPQSPPSPPQQFPPCLFPGGTSSLWFPLTKLPPVGPIGLPLPILRTVSGQPVKTFCWFFCSPCPTW